MFICYFIYFLLRILYIYLCYFLSPLLMHLVIALTKSYCLMLYVHFLGGTDIPHHSHGKRSSVPQTAKWHSPICTFTTSFSKCYQITIFLSWRIFYLKLWAVIENPERVSVLVEAIEYNPVSYHHRVFSFRRWSEGFRGCRWWSRSPPGHLMHLIQVGRLC